MYDIVIPLKEARPNIDLRFTLRSIAKFGYEFGRVWLVGFKPNWIQNVEYISTVQTSDKWTNTRRNLEEICLNPELSENFLLFNDDFILSKKIESWDWFSDMYLGTLSEHAEEFSKVKKKSTWQAGFEYNQTILRKLGCSTQFDFEYHGPMLMNKNSLAELFERIKTFYDSKDGILFKRSLYGNLYGKKPARKIDDIKFVSDCHDFKKVYVNRCFSVGDNVIGNLRKAPKLQVWFNSYLNEKSVFEK